MFIDRDDAAQQLINQLQPLRTRKDLVVLAIPRGGLPIAAAIATYLHALLDIILAKKIGFPGEPELAIGAATSHAVFINPTYDTPDMQAHIADEIDRVQKLLHTRAKQYRAITNAVPLKNKNVLIVDDGIATGHTMLAAVRDVLQQKPHEIIVVTPVIAQDTLALFQKMNIKVISIITPTHMMGIGQFYEKFPQISDEQALRIMHNHHQMKDMK